MERQFYMFNNYNPWNKSEKHTIKDWELNTGVKIISLPKNKTSQNKIRTNMYTRRSFKKIVAKSRIVCKTEKGLEFLKCVHN